jgi:Ni2+-binding GTPase involved in maturation of urease and hydrogenase
LRIGLIGEAGSGKTTLAFSFSNFLRKKGFSCEVANLDITKNKPKYQAFFEARKLGEKTLKTTYAKIAEEPRILKNRADFILLDTTGSLEFFLLDPGLLRECCDRVFIVSDYAVARPVDSRFLNSLAALAEKRFGKKTLLIVNKSDLCREKPQHTLYSPAERLENAERMVFASGKEGLGFNELMNFVEGG